MNASSGTIEKYQQNLMRQYKARNIRHLMYILYNRKDDPYGYLLATKRDLEILKLYVLGKNYDQIGNELGIHYRTVKQHINNLILRNKCQDPKELVILYADWEKQNVKNTPSELIY